MKLTLLLSALFISGVTFAQETIPAFYDFNTIPGSAEGDYYHFATLQTALDETATGANVIWNFNGITSNNRSSTVVIVPTAEDVATFPGSTMLVQTTTTTGVGTSSVTKYYLASNASGGTSLTGFDAAGIILNYSTDNGFIGNFPLTYGYSNIDTVAGTFEGMGLSGTFTGTGVSIVDAYGTLNTDLVFAENIPATRLKTVQDINLIYMGATVGTLTQTIYSYYYGVLDGPAFRSITNTLTVPSMEINQTTRSAEAYTEMILSTGNLISENKTAIAPNPVANVLHFSGNDAITGVTITDTAGRTVLQIKASNDIMVNHLSAGVYYVTVQSGNITEVQKMVKR